MSFLIHCTLFLTLAAVLLLSSFCIRASAAAAPPPSFPPACPLNPSCSSPSFPPLPSWPPYVLPFNQSSLCFSANLSSSVTFSIDFTDELSVDCTPFLAFTLFLPSPPILALSFDLDNTKDSHCTPAHRRSCLAVCESQDSHSQKPTNSSCEYLGRDQSDSEGETHIKYTVSLAYKAESAAVHVQALVDYGGFKINQTFIFMNTTDLQPDDNMVNLLVYYSTGGNGTNITPAPTMNDAFHTNANPSKSSHIVYVVVWVIVGVSMVAFLVGLIILALSIKKYRSRRASRVSSHSPAERAVPPSTTTRAPFPHRCLESSVMPMLSPFPPSPPNHMHTNDFQISGTASWLKQPNPR